MRWGYSKFIQIRNQNFDRIDDYLPDSNEKVHCVEPSTRGST